MCFCETSDSAGPMPMCRVVAVGMPAPGGLGLGRGVLGVPFLLALGDASADPFASLSRPEMG